MILQTDETQEFADRFYAANGPCCAGCDWWRHLNPVVGECTRSAPTSGPGRFAMVGIDHSSLAADAGHIMTPREHRCGEFSDTFDWLSLPLHYRRRIGMA